MAGSERERGERETHTDRGTVQPDDNMYRIETDGMGLERKGNKTWIKGKVMFTLGLETGRLVCWNKIGSENSGFLEMYFDQNR